MTSARNIGTPARIWIDLDNSPHVPFFAPIITALREDGHAVTLTSRDNAQVAGLVALNHLETTQIGAEFGKQRILKIAGTLWRALRLARHMLLLRPTVAISHGSRSQVLASKILRIPSIVIMDYEFANSSPWLESNWLITPESIPKDRWGLIEERILRYPGLKEDVYADCFTPDPNFATMLDIRPDAIVVTIRPPATEAHYHSPASDTLFQSVMAVILRDDRTQIVLLPRTRAQWALVRERWKDEIGRKQILLPDAAIDGLNLIWHSDLIISGGGTMNREAAALGVPVYSIFRGRIGAVDEELARQGRLVLIETADDVTGKIRLEKRERREAPPESRKARSTILEHIEKILTWPSNSSTSPFTDDRV